MRRMATAAMAFVVFGFLGVATASAQEQEVESIFYDFADMDIDGDLRRPDGSLFTQRGGAAFSRLLDMSRSFIDEVEASAEESALR